MRAVEPNHVRPVWAEISATRLATNYRHTRAAAGMELLAVVKADAYGHGAELCAPVLAGSGAAWLGVTSVEEGVRVM
jgi:alanine racemase